jgi:effector-binding domain-containing protein
MHLGLCKTLATGLILCLLGCSDHKEEQPLEQEIPVINYKTAKDSAKQEQAPIINIIDTATPEWKVVYMKDSSSSSDGIALKLAAIYHRKLPEFIRKNKLEISGPFIAWYTQDKKGSGFFFEAGIPVNKKPLKSSKKILFRQIGRHGDSALIAHYYGPYELTYYAYDALKERMNDLKKTPKGKIFEVYIDNPIDEKGNRIDPYKVRTDIVALYD